MIAATLVAQNVIFGVLALVMVVAGFKLVTTRNVVRAALFLAVVLAGVAGQFLLLAAEFVAVVQILVYIGAVVVLLLFGVMLTRAPIGTVADVDNDQRWLGALVSLLLLAALATVLNDAWGSEKIEFGAIQSVGQISDAIFGPYVIAFEVASILLLAALVGAVAIARRD